MDRGGSSYVAAIEGLSADVAGKLVVFMVSLKRRCLLVHTGADYIRRRFQGPQGTLSLGRGFRSSHGISPGLGAKKGHHGEECNVPPISFHGS